MTDKKLMKLTTEQEKLLPIYRDEGIKIGLALDEGITDGPAIHELLNNLRERTGQPIATKFKLLDSPKAASKYNDKCTPSTAMYGSQDINWVQYYRIFKKEFGIEVSDEIDIMFELATKVGWIWLSEDENIVTRRPTTLNMIQKGNDIKVLHNYDGPALEYADGFAVHAINGTRIPAEFVKHVITPADEIDVKDILSIKNTEIRTEFLKKVGIDKAFESLNKTKLDTSDLDIGGKYELFSVEFGPEATRLYLRGECPSNAEAFFEAVHPDCKTVEQALNFRNGFKIDVPFVSPLALT